MTNLSASFVDNYLRRIQENRALREATIFTSKETKVELDASKIVFIPATIEGVMATESAEFNQEIVFDYNLDQVAMEQIVKTNSFTLNCKLSEGFSKNHIYSLQDLKCEYDDYNPAIQKGVYVTLNKKKAEDSIILLNDKIAS